MSLRTPSLNALAPLALLALSVPVALPLAAQPPTLTIDQEQPAVDAAASTLAVGGPSEQKLAQTVTVGRAGRLAEVRFAIGCADGVLEIEIQGVDGAGVPDGVPLLRRRVRADRLPAVVPATFEALPLPRRLRIAPGDRLAVVLSNPTGSCGVARSPAGDLYAGGQAFFDARPNPPGWVPFTPSEPSDDLPFQTVVFGR